MLRRLRMTKQAARASSAIETAAAPMPMPALAVWVSPGEPDAAAGALEVDAAPAAEVDDVVPEAAVLVDLAEDADVLSHVAYQHLLPRYANGILTVELTDEALLVDVICDEDAEGVGGGVVAGIGARVEVVA